MQILHPKQLSLIPGKTSSGNPLTSQPQQSEGVSSPPEHFKN